MSDGVRQATIAAINALRAGCEFSPKGESITAAYVDVWAAAFTDAKISPQEIVLSAREYLGSHAHYPAVAQVVKIAQERRDHRNQLARANYYIQPGPALPMGKVTDEDRAAARARLGISDEDKRKLEIERRRDSGNVGGQLSEGLGSLVDAAVPSRRGS